MTIGEWTGALGLLVALLGASFNYFRLEHSQRSELWSVGRRMAAFFWRCANVASAIFFIVWPIAGIWAFATGEGPPSRAEIMMLALQFFNFFLWGALSMTNLRNWLRSKKEAREKAQSAIAAEGSIKP